MLTDLRGIPNYSLLATLHQSDVHRTTPFPQSHIFDYNFCLSQRCWSQQLDMHGNRVRLIVLLQCSAVMKSYDFGQQREQVSAMGYSAPGEVRMDSNSVLMLAEGSDDGGVFEGRGRERHVRGTGNGRYRKRCDALILTTLQHHDCYERAADWKIGIRSQQARKR
jgi:hypothetical protein